MLKVGSLVPLAALTAAQYYIAVGILDLKFPSWLPAYVVFAGSTLVLFVLDLVYIKPVFRNPYKHLPQISDDPFFELKLPIERPRGKTPLTWFQRYPDADLICTYSFINGFAVLPAGPSALRDVMNTNAYDFIKPPDPARFLARIIGWGLILAEGDAHKRQRKALTPAFNIKNIRALYPLMWEKCGVLLDQLDVRNARDGSIEISSWASLLTLDIIGPAALSRDLQSMTAGEEHELAKAFAEILEPSLTMAAFFGSCFFVPEWLHKRLPIRPNRVLHRQTTIMRTICRGILNEKKAKGFTGLDGKIETEEHDILQNIISTGEFSDEEIIDQMLTFLAAGHETTASALTWLVHLLTLPENRHYQKVLRDEIRSAVATSTAPGGKLTADAAPTYLTLESLPYLNGLCEETFRLFPTVPTTLRENIRETTICGTRLRTGTNIPIVTYAINRHPKYWGPDAAVMKPERWIDQLPDGSLRANKHGGVPSNFCEVTFLHGPRTCIGRDFAKAELRCAVAALFGRYDVTRLPGDNGEVEIAGTITTKPEGGLRVHLERMDGW